MRAIAPAPLPPAIAPGGTAPRYPKVPGGNYKWIAAAIIALGSTSSILSSTVVNVAIPALQKVFGASLTDVQWIVTGYLLGLAAAIPVSGYLTDRFGSKRVYMTTLTAFSVTSLLCGFAWSTSSEIAFRVIQGVAGGMVMPVGMTILMRMTPPHERGRMMGILGVPLLLAPAMGPAVGGWLLLHFDWRFVFWVNLPTGLLAIGFGAFYLRESQYGNAGRLDLVGLLLATPGVAVLIYGFTRASGAGWGSPTTLVPLAGGVALIAGFVIWELRTRQPLLDIRVLNDAAFAAALGVSTIVSISLFGATFLIPVFLQQVQGYDTLGAGLIVGAQGVGAAAVMPLSGYLTDRYGARPVVFAGLSVLAIVSFLVTTVGVGTPRMEWIVLLGCRGVAIGFAMMPAFSAAYVTIAPSAIGRATAMSNTVQRIGSSFGVAIFATVTESRVADHLAQLPRGAQAGRAAAAAAAAAGFDDALWLAAGLVLFGLPAAILLRRSRPAAEDPGASHPPLPGPLRVLAGLLLVGAAAGLAGSVAKTFGLLP